MEAKALIDRTMFFLEQASLEEQFVRTHIAELRELLVAHNTRYYQTSDPIISDTAYDELFLLLQTREDAFPDLMSSESPTQRLVGQKLEGFSSVAHLAVMGSLQNTYSAEDIDQRDAWLRRIQQKQDISAWTYIIEPKLDGLSVEIVYEFGVFTRAVTRGDGQMGEDITEHAKQLSWLPRKIQALSWMAAIAFRGEIVIPKDAFLRLASARTTWGTLFANARNAAAGTLRQLDTNLVRERGLEVFIYDVLFHSDPLPCGSAAEQFELFRAWELPIMDWLQTYSSIEDVIQRCGAPATKQHADEQRIDLDGLVVKIQEFTVREQFWSTNHHPKWAIAYKFPAQQIVTQLLDVSFQVGRTGILTPVAHLAPVQLSGVTISRATLHNRAFIQERDLRVSDRVLIQRSGEVIPYILNNIPERREGTEQPVVLPTHCPVCDHPVYLDDRWLALRCGNTACAAQVKQRLEHAVSKSCFSIDWLWPSLIASCVDAWVLKTIADIFVLFTTENKRILRLLPSIGDKKIAHLEKEIAGNVPYPLWKVIHAMGIRHIGEVSSRDLAANYLQDIAVNERSLETFLTYCAAEDLLERIHWFGKEMIASVRLFFADTINRAVFERLATYGVINRHESSEQGSSWGVLSDMHIVLTGSFPISRSELATCLRTHGAIIQESVTAKTTLLIAGVWGGSKRQQAEKWWVSLMSLEQVAMTYTLPELLTLKMSGQQDIPTPWVQQASLF